MVSFCSHIADIKHSVLENLALQAERPLLNLRRHDLWINSADTAYGEVAQRAARGVRQRNAGAAEGGSIAEGRVRKGWVFIEEGRNLVVVETVTESKNGLAGLAKQSAT